MTTNERQEWNEWARTAIARTNAEAAAAPLLTGAEARLATLGEVIETYLDQTADVGTYSGAPAAQLRGLAEKLEALADSIHERLGE